MQKFNNKKYALPGQPISQRAFEAMICEADNGPFHSLEQVRIAIDKWKVKYAK